MSDRPIIFSAPMVRALLDGRKTQTRRLAWRDRAHGVGQSPAPSPWQSVRSGDRLWVREAWGVANDGCHPSWLSYRADPPGTRGKPCSPGRRYGSRLKWQSPIHMPRWVSRITLHVEAARVERLQDISEDDAQAEGLACLSKDGGRVYKWGLPDRDGYPGRDDDGWPWTMWCVGHKPAFAALWGSLHGDGAWQRNPEVVVITFRVERGNIDRDARDA